MALNADAKKKPKATVTRIHPAVVVRDSTKERAQRDPDRAHVDVSQPRQAPLPLDVAPAPPAEVPDVAAKKKTKKNAKKRSPHGSKRAFIEAHPELSAKDLVKLGKEQGVVFTDTYVYNVRSVGKGNPTKRGKPKKKRGRVVASVPLPPGRVKRSPVTSRFVEALSEILAPMVSELVTSEIRKRLA